MRNQLEIFQQLTQARGQLELAKQQKELENYFQDIIIKLQLMFNSKKEIGNHLTEKKGVDQKGRIPKNKKEKEHSYRSFKGDRERQTLIHSATQFYFALEERLPKKNHKELVEIQILHLEFKGKNNLFVIANKTTVMKKFSEMIEQKPIKELLLRIYKPEKAVGKERSKRYGSKLKTRIFDELKIIGNNSKDIENAKAIGNILREGSPTLVTLYYSRNELCTESQKLLKEKILAQDKHIHFINLVGYSNETRHAEEFLCDIAEYARELDSTTYSCIAGKNRPCIACTAKMKVAGISNYGKFPGRYYSHTITNQSEKVIIEIIKLLWNESSHVSVNKDGKIEEGYNSDSDSEDENPSSKFTS